MEAVRDRQVGVNYEGPFHLADRPRKACAANEPAPSQDARRMAALQKKTSTETLLNKVRVAMHLLACLNNGVERAHGEAEIVTTDRTCLVSRALGGNGTATHPLHRDEAARKAVRRYSTLEGLGDEPCRHLKIGVQCLYLRCIASGSAPQGAGQLERRQNNLLHI